MCLPTVALVLGGAALAAAHVSLSFPPARYPPLDFLDNVRTPKPCGVARPHPDTFHKLVAGQTYNITWLMRYRHSGGYRLSILDQHDTLLHAFQSDFTGATHASSVALTLPGDLTCQRCTLRLERQALEWGATYIFHSCSDVNILPAGTQLSHTARCTGRGLFVDGVCECQKSYTGSVCQFDADCHVDADCKNGGKCVVMQNGIRRLACFCQAPFFGANCEKSNAGDSSESCFNYAGATDGSASTAFSNYNLFNADCYTRIRLGPSDSMYHRKIDDEMEVILDYKSTSWVALGWRPATTNAECRQFLSHGHPTAEPTAEAEAEPGAEAEATAEPEGGSEPTHAEPESEAEPTAKPEPEAEAESSGEPEPEPEGESGGSALHAMDCLDVVVGSARDGRGCVLDHYTRDRSTPLPDRYYLGRDSLTAARAVQVDERTVVMFRRAIKATEKADQRMGPGALHMVWAKGQENDAYYVQDELMYHGGSRGIVSSAASVLVTAEKQTQGAAVASTSALTLLFFAAVTLLRAFLSD